MARLRRSSVPALFLAGGAVLLVGTIIAWGTLRLGARSRRAATSTAATTSASAAAPAPRTRTPGSLSGGRTGSGVPSVPTTTTAPSPPPATTTTPATTAGAPPPLGFSWRAAGAFVWHTTDVDPAALGALMRANGFGWVAIRIGDGVSADPVNPAWIALFRGASGLPVGGWSVLRDQPLQEAQLAATQIARDGLDFYIADAEADYASTGAPERESRSERFLRAFRLLLPTLPAGLSSYCRLDIPGVDWGAWRNGDFAFLPQAYVDQFGAQVAPAACVAAAAPYFPRNEVHPTIGSFPAAGAPPSPDQYAKLLQEAGTVGFSIYLAETNMPADSWRTYGEAIRKLGIAALP